MWSRKDKDVDTILVATHVDDSIVTGSNDDETDTFVRDMLERVDLEVRQLTHAPQRVVALHRLGEQGANDRHQQLLRRRFPRHGFLLAPTGQHRLSFER
jgi:hypothetical protein